MEQQSAGGADAVWADLLDMLAGGWSVVHSDERSTTLRPRRRDSLDVLKFGPAEWADLVRRGPNGDDQPDGAELTETPGWAFDLLWETLASKGSPLVIREDRLERE